MALLCRIIGSSLLLLLVVGSSTRQFAQGFVVVAHTISKTTTRFHQQRTVMRDEASVMEDFFTQRSDYVTVFCNMATDLASQNTESLLDSIIDDTTINKSPLIKNLPAIPTLESDKQLVSNVLDALHQSLLDIPVTVGADEEEETPEDLDFLEQGRRLLTIGRFVVVQQQQQDTLETLFRYCWSELEYLHTCGTAHSGTLLVVPSVTDSVQLEQFMETNLRRPLAWLGNTDFEICKIGPLERSVCAIQLIYKLQDMPEDVEGGLVE